MNIMQWFCSHQMVSHAKEKYEYTTKELVEGTEHWHHPIIQDITYSNITEVLICKECGKIEIIKY